MENENPPIDPNLGQAKCPHCEKVQLVRKPKIDIVNRPTFSVIMIAHDTPVTCDQCFNSFVVVIHAIDPAGRVIMGWLPVETQTIVRPPAGVQIS